MPQFVYTARDQSGLLQTGKFETIDEDEAVSALQQRGLIVTSLRRGESQGMLSAPRPIHRRFHGRVTGDDQVLFCQQMATLLDAGISLTRALEVLEAQVESRKLLSAVEQIRKDVEAGRAFYQALAKHPKIFSRFWINLVETGEASGHLAQALSQLARYLETTRTIQSKATTAMMYPMFLILAATGAVAFFLIRVIPTFEGIFSSMNIQLPALTLFVIHISRFVSRWYNLLMIIGVVGVLGYALVQFIRTEQGRWVFDRLLLRLPLVSQIATQLQLTQFSRGLGTLLQSGVPILVSLEVLEHSATNKVYGKAIGDVKEFVRQGKTMAEPMERTGLFPPMAVQMVRVGEEAGELSKMLERLANYYEERLNTFIERMTVLFEPIAIVVMAGIIGTLVVSMFLPIFSLAGGGGGFTAR